MDFCYRTAIQIAVLQWMVSLQMSWILKGSNVTMQQCTLMKRRRFGNLVWHGVMESLNLLENIRTFARQYFLQTLSKTIQMNIGISGVAELLQKLLVHCLGGFYPKALCTLMQCRLDCIEHCDGQLESFAKQCESLRSMLPNCSVKLSNGTKMNKAMQIIVRYRQRWKRASLESRAYNDFNNNDMDLFLRCQLWHRPTTIDSRVGFVLGGPT